MTAKEYLKRAKMLNKEINTKQIELDGLRLNATSISSPPTTEKVQSNGKNDSMRTIDKIIDLENTINLEIDRLVDLKAEIRDKIAQTYNPIFISILTNIYINNLSLEETAELMEKDYRTICRWHGQALQAFRKENNMV